jgi:hypothetical protein
MQGKGVDNIVAQTLLNSKKLKDNFIDADLLAGRNTEVVSLINLDRNGSLGTPITKWY